MMMMIFTVAFEMEVMEMILVGRCDGGSGDDDDTNNAIK